MARKVAYDTLVRATKKEGGVKMAYIKYDDGRDSIDIGTISRNGDMHVATLFDGSELAQYSTNSKAGEGLKKHYDAMQSGEAPVLPTQRLLTLEEAAEELCGEAANPLAALKKRISRGKITVMDTKDGKRVVL